MSFATVYWLDIFTRQVYFNILAESIDYCRAEKDMEIYAYCFMPSHVHLLFRSANEQPMVLLRDFKRHTAKKVIEAIENNPQESRKEWLLWMLKRAGKKQGNITNYQFWQHNNKPIRKLSFSKQNTNRSVCMVSKITGKNLRINASYFRKSLQSLF